MLRTIIFRILLLALAATAQAQFTFTKIADTGTAIPSGSGAFTDLRYPSVRGTNAVFYGEGTTGQMGIYFWNGTSLARVADLATPVPGGGGNFTNINFNAYAISTNSVVFIGSSSSGIGLYQGINNTLTRLVDSSMAIPSGSGTFNGFGGPRIDNNGALAFTGRGPGQQGIYLYNNGTPVKVADKSTTLPGGANYGVTDVATLRGGRIAFWNYTAANYNGIYFWDGATFSRVAYTNTLIPGFGIPFEQLNSPPDFDAGQVLFKCSTFTGGYKAGIYQVNPDGSGLTTLVDSTMTIPGGTDLFNDFLGFQRANGVLVFVGYGPPSYQRGVYTLSNNVIARVLGPNDPLGGKVVSQADMLDTGFVDGMLGMLVSFTDNSKGIYLTRLTSNSSGPTSPRFDSIQPLSAGQIQLTITASAGETHRLQFSTNLTSWTNISSLTFTGSSLTVTDAPPPVSMRFYRTVSP